MTIKYHCVECGVSLKIKDELAGTDGTCPKCHTKFTVPSPKEAPEAPEAADDDSAAAAADDPSAAQQPAKPKSRAGDTPPAKKAAGDAGFSEDDIESILLADGPERKPPKPKSSPVGSAANKDDDDDDHDEEPLSLDDGPAPSRSRAAKRGDSDSDSETASEMVEAALLDKRKPKSREPAPPRPSAAEISRELMKPSEDGKREEKPKKKGRGFGEGAPERPDETLVSALVRSAKDMGPQLGLGVGGTVIAVIAVYWFASSMSPGPKLPPLGRVSGSITLNDKPLAFATVTFIPLVEAQQPGSKPAKGVSANQAGNSVAMTDQEGKYSLKYSADVLGAVVGKHYVRITAEDNEGHQLVPDDYNLKSVLTAEVKEGSNSGPSFNFAIKAVPTSLEPKPADQ